MPMTAWDVSASAAMSIIVGVFIVLALVIYERMRGRMTTSGKFVGCLLLTTAVYTLLVTTIGYFYGNISIPVMVTAYFGEARFAWLFVGLAADGFARIYNFFD